MKQLQGISKLATRLIPILTSVLLLVQIAGGVADWHWPSVVLVIGA